MGCFVGDADATWVILWVVLWDLLCICFEVAVFLLWFCFEDALFYKPSVNNRHDTDCTQPASLMCPVVCQRVNAL